MSVAHNYIPNDSEIPELYTQDGLGSDAVVHIKLFTPFSSWTWLLTEYSPDQKLAFGFCYNAAMPDCAEIGYVSIAELETLKSPFGDPAVERDILFTPKKLSEAKKRYCPDV